jgi:hypothetical protein
VDFRGSHLVSLAKKSQNLMSYSIKVNHKEGASLQAHISVSLVAAVGCLLVSVTVAQAAPCARAKAQADAWVNAKVNALVQAARGAYEDDRALPTYERVLDGIADTIRDCNLAADHNFITRYKNFLEFVEAAGLERKANHELGFLVPDKQYFAETSQYVGIPEFLLEPAFVQNVSRFETLARAKSYLQQLNKSRGADEQLIFFSYTSRHLGTPDNDASYVRLLVVVPGNAAKGVPDKWVQFGVPDPGMRARVRNVSVVSALTGPNGTFNAYFKDFFRTYRRDGSITIKGRWELGEGDDNCAMCHKSGVLPIFPVSGTVSAAEQQALLTVNERFRSYGSPRFGGYLDETKLGPGLGSANSEDRTRRFGPRFDQTPAAKAMVCSSCHNAQRLGALNWPMDKTIIESYVTGGQMPFGHQLKAFDRRRLYASLVEEYFAIGQNNPGILKSWLLGQPAEGFASFTDTGAPRSASGSSQEPQR